MRRGHDVGGGEDQEEIEGRLGALRLPEPARGRQRPRGGQYTLPPMRKLPQLPACLVAMARVRAAVLLARRQRAASGRRLQPDRVFDGERCRPGGSWWCAAIASKPPVRPRRRPCRPARARSRCHGHDADARLDRRPLAPVAASLQRDHAGTIRCCAKPLALRVARGVNHARATLMAGITTVRDLGTEGAAYADVGLRAGDQRRASFPARACWWPVRRWWSPAATRRRASRPR